MPHSTDTRTCPYCGRPLRGKEVVCWAHEDLPALEPLDDRFLLQEERT